MVPSLEVPWNVPILPMQVLHERELSAHTTTTKKGRKLTNNNSYKQSSLTGRVTESRGQPLGTCRRRTWAP